VQPPTYLTVGMYDDVEKRHPHILVVSQSRLRRDLLTTAGIASGKKVRLQ